MFAAPKTIKLAPIIFQHSLLEPTHPTHFFFFHFFFPFIFYFFSITRRETAFLKLRTFKILSKLYQLQLGSFTNTWIRARASVLTGWIPSRLFHELLRSLVLIEYFIDMNIHTMSTSNETVERSSSISLAEYDFRQASWRQILCDTKPAHSTLKPVQLTAHQDDRLLWPFNRERKKIPSKKFRLANSK